MTSKTFSGGRIREAAWDRATQQLDLRFDDGNLRAYGHVPEEVFRRLCSAPNPATYWEDRVAEEYPKATPKLARQGAGGPDLRDLFGEPPADD